MYAWNDLNRRGRQVRPGHGVRRALRGRAPSGAECGTVDSRRRPVAGCASPGQGPSPMAVNLGYRARDRLATTFGRGSSRAVEDGAFPINGNEVYYRLFGRKGFREYQMVVPTAAWSSAAARCNERSRRPACRSPLGRSSCSRAIPTCCGSGETGCASPSTHRGERTRALFDRLDRVAVEHGAPITSPRTAGWGQDVVRAVYPGLRGVPGAPLRLRPQAAIRLDAAAADRCLSGGTPL